MILRHHTLSNDCNITDMLPYQDKELLFFDIETTGFSPKTAAVYLIGAAFFQDHAWNILQWLAVSPAEEPDILRAFFTLCRKRRCLIHFNGQRFDIPFLEKRSQHYGISSPLFEMESVDLYQRIRPCGEKLQLEHLNQKTLERFLGIRRQDTFTGGELIPLYRKLTVQSDFSQAAPLLLHNLDDVKGLLFLLPLLAYPALFCEHRYTTGRISWEEAPNRQPQLILELSLQLPIPKRISCRLKSAYLTVEGFVCRLLVQALEGELKYFFPDYRNYYYLPLEDRAMHKSVAAYAAPSKRQQAKAETCYQRYFGLFLPQNSPLFQPVFRESLKNPSLWFECTDTFMNTPDALSRYIKSLISD